MLIAAVKETRISQNAGARREWNVSVSHEDTRGVVPPKMAWPVVTLKATPEKRHLVGKKEAI